MQKCRVSVVSSADGQENAIVRVGEMQIDGLGCTLRYFDEAAVVEIALQGGAATIVRCGDYEMRLVLCNGETREGTLGILGAEGKVWTKTHRVKYSISECSVLLSVRYDLLFGKEKQEMKIRIYAKY